MIGFQSREANRCISSEDDMGQNFTVEVPNTAPDRTALIRVVRVTLVGAGYYLYMEALNTTGNIA